MGARPRVLTSTHNLSCLAALWQRDHALACAQPYELRGRRTQARPHVLAPHPEIPPLVPHALYGTKNGKRAHSQRRPHARSALLSHPAPCCPATNNDTEEEKSESELHSTARFVIKPHAKCCSQHRRHRHRPSHQTEHPKP